MICEHDKFHCEEGIVISSIMDTVSITLYIFLVSLILNFLIFFVGEEQISHLILNRPILGPILAGLVGLIPNCASSVILAELYLGNLISAGTMLAGLLVGAGIGLLVLFKENNKIKENIKIVSLLYVIGVAFGIVFEAIKLDL